MPLKFSCIKKSFTLQNKAFTKWETQLKDPNITKLQKSTIKKNLTDKISLIKEKYSEFWNTEHPDEEMDRLTDLFDSLMETGNNLMSELELLDDCKELVPAPVVTDSCTNNLRVKLPKIEIPVFSGNILEFYQFWSLFESCVDSNPNLDSCSKLSYLLSLLSGDALLCLSGLPVIDSNYSVAKDLLRKRYGETHKLIQAHFRAIKGLSLKDETPIELRRFLDTFRVNLRSLESLKVDISSHNVLLYDVLTDRLPNRLKSMAIKFIDSNMAASNTVDLYVLLDKIDRDVASTLQSTSTGDSSDSNVCVNEIKHIVTNRKPAYNTEFQVNNCRYCARSHNRGHCFAYGKICSICHRRNHFSNCCPNKSQYRKISNVSSDAEIVQAVSTSTVKEEQTDNFHLCLNLNGHNKTFLIDSGAQISIITKDLYMQYFRGTELKPISTNFLNFDCSQLKMLGKVLLKVQYKSFSGFLSFYVAESGTNIIGRDMFKTLGISLCVQSVQNTSHKEILDRYPNVLEQTTGIVPGLEVALILEKDYKPCIKSPYRVPMSLQDKLKSKIQEYLDAGYIEPLESLVEFLSPIVIVPKKSDIRMCIDYKGVNKHLIVQQHYIPYAEDIFAKLSEAKYFSCLDLKNGYHHLKLTDDSKNLTAFTSIFGNYRFKVLPFGLSDAPSIFARVIAKVLKNCNNCAHFFDDIIVYGTTVNEHNIALDNVLKALSRNNLHINLSKCVFMSESVTYLGQVIANGSMKASAKNVDSLLNCRRPQNKHDVHIFLGLVNYHSRYIENLAKITEPIRKLLVDNVEFSWSYEAEQSFTSLKKIMSSHPIVKIYNPKLQNVVSCDASYEGLGGCLQQITENGDLQVVSYVSRSLTDTEKKYSVTELEMLACVFSVQRFHHFLFGRPFTLQIDHKPLESLLTKTNSNASLKLSRLAEKLQNYNFDVVYVPGKNHCVPDALSRLPSDTIVDTVSEMSSISLVHETSLNDLECLSIEMLKEESKKDKLITLVKKYVSTGWPKRIGADLRPFKSLHFGLAIENDILLYGPSRRFVVPKSLQTAVLAIGHYGHRAIARTKSYLRQFVYWPGMNKEIEKYVKTCCQDSEKALKIYKPPVQPIPPPTHPWQDITADIGGPVTNLSRYFLVIIDRFTKWPEVFILKKIDAANMIECFETLFYKWGHPVSLLTDNGPQFRAKLFEDFLIKHNVYHKLSCPYNPQANGLSENFVKFIKNSLKNINFTSVKSLQNYLQKVLFSYRCTPHSATLISPCVSMTGWQFNSGLPRVLPASDTSVTQRTQSLRDNILKDHLRWKNTSGKQCQLKINDLVRVKQVDGKYSRPMKIVKQLGPYSYELEGGIKRNVRRLAKCPLQN